MHGQDLLSSSLVWPVDQDLPVETSGAQQRRIQHFRSVSRAKQYQAARRVKTVELGEELVQCLVFFVMSAAGISAAGAAQRIELVDEDDRRRVLARLFEKVADAGGADPDKHLDKLRARD